MPMRELTPEENGYLLMAVSMAAIVIFNPVFEAYGFEGEQRQQLVASMMVLFSAITLFGPRLICAMVDGVTLEKDIRRALHNASYPHLDRTRLLDAKNSRLWGLYRHNLLRRWFGINNDAFVFSLVKHLAMPVFVSHPQDRLGLTVPGQGIVESIYHYEPLARDHSLDWLSHGFFAYWLFKASRVESEMGWHFKKEGQKNLWDDGAVMVHLPDEMINHIMAFVAHPYIIEMLDECMNTFQSQQPHTIQGPWGGYLSGRSAEDNLAANGVTDAYHRMKAWAETHGAFFTTPKTRVVCMQVVGDVLTAPEIAH